MVNFASFFSDFILSIFGGDFIFFSIFLLTVVSVLLLWANARASSVVLVVMCLSYAFAFFVPQFKLLFWLGVISGIFLLLIGIRRFSLQ